jgi:hypothetical protein
MPLSARDGLPSRPLSPNICQPIERREEVSVNGRMVGDAA